MKYLLMILIPVFSSCVSKPKVERADVRRFKVGDCIALISRIEVVDKNDRYLIRPSAHVLDIVFKITELDDKERFYIMAFHGGRDNGIPTAKDYDFADSNYQRLNCDEKYEIDGK